MLEPRCKPNRPAKCWPPVLRRPKIRVLVTGGAGYIGSVLVRQLLARGHRVTVVDSLLWGIGPLQECARADVEGNRHWDGACQVIRGDIRAWNDAWLDGIDAVCHLAGLSNDPTADFDPQLNSEVNAQATHTIAWSVANAGIRRFTYASSASIYDDGSGVAGEPLAEDAAVHPVGGYSITKHQGEKSIRFAAETFPKFDPFILRQATVFGHSPRMRFDLVVNAMVRSALTDGIVQVHENAGIERIYRPLVSVREVAQAHVKALDHELVGVFNVCANNWTLMELALAVQAEMKAMSLPCEIETVAMPAGRRVRNYKMSNGRYALRIGPVTDDLPEAIREMIEAWKGQDMSLPEYENIKWMTRHAETA